MKNLIVAAIAFLLPSDEKEAPTHLKLDKLLTERIQEKRKEARAKLEEAYVEAMAESAQDLETRIEQAKKKARRDIAQYKRAIADRKQELDQMDLEIAYAEETGNVLPLVRRFLGFYAVTDHTPQGTRREVVEDLVVIPKGWTPTEKED